MVDVRNAFRYPTMRDATLILSDGVRIKCTVSDISTKGARIELPAPQKLPEQFFLFIRGQNQRFRCQRAWQKDAVVGVQYLL